MQIRGREVDFKIGRLKDAAAFEKALDKMSKTEKVIKARVGHTFPNSIYRRIPWNVKVKLPSENTAFTAILKKGLY